MASDRLLKQHEVNGGKKEDEKWEMNLRAGEGPAAISLPVIRKDEENKKVNSVSIQTNNSASLGCSLEINTHLFHSQ